MNATRSVARSHPTEPELLELRVVIPGNPAPKGRPRFVRHPATGRMRAITPKRTLAYEAHVRTSALAASTRWPHRNGRGPYKAEIRVWTKTWQRRDVDNLAKTILDACNHVLWHDDADVHHLIATRAVDAVNPRVELTVTCLACRRLQESEAVTVAGPEHDAYTVIGRSNPDPGLAGISFTASLDSGRTLAPTKRRR